VRLSLSSTSTRTFVLWPAVVVAERAVRRRGPTPARALLGAPLMAAGWLLYRECGRYRIVRAGGPPGMSQGMPDRLVTSGPYAWSRNPMYAGHLTFLAGLAVASGSPAAAAVLAGHVPWFARRVGRDEARLRDRFGASYDAFAARVPRWLPNPLMRRRPMV
jgi:protein-S-isoprenylcysteine O-methyltransferase Ste14